MKRLACLLLLVGGVVACGSGSDEDGVADDALSGNWASTCYADTNATGEIQNYIKDKLVVASGRFTLTQVYHAPSDASCGQARWTEVIKSDAIVGAAVSAPEGARSLDLTPRSYEQTPNTAEIVQVFNQTKQCGYSDWSLNTAKDVTAASACVAATAMATYYDVYKISGNTLSFGYSKGGDDGSSTDKRPKTLDPARQYQKTT